MYTTTKSGQRCIQQTTLGLNLFILWNNGTGECIPLKYLKDSKSVEVAKFASETGIGG